MGNGFVFASRRSGDGANNVLPIEWYGSVVLEWHGVDRMHIDGERDANR